MNLNSRLAGGLALAIGLAFTSNTAFADGCGYGPTGDPGYGWSTGHIVFNKQEGSTAYCRVVGNAPNSWIRCTINKNNTCTDFNSKSWGDMGYENTQYWADINDDGIIDFCREVGNKPNTFTSCIIGPDFAS